MHVKRSQEMHGVLYNEKLAKNERKWVGLRLDFLIFFYGEITIYEIICHKYYMDTTFG